MFLISIKAQVWIQGTNTPQCKSTRVFVIPLLQSKCVSRFPPTEGGTTDTQRCSWGGLASRCHGRRTGVSPFNSPRFSTYSVFTTALTTPSGKKLSDVSTPPWLSENVCVAQGSENNWGVCTNRKGLSRTDSTERKIFSLQKPQEGFHPVLLQAGRTVLLCQRGASPLKQSLLVPTWYYIASSIQPQFPSLLCKPKA